MRSAGQVPGADAGCCCAGSVWRIRSPDQQAFFPQHGVDTDPVNHSAICGAAVRPVTGARIIALIAAVVVLAAVIGFGGWYCWGSIADERAVVATIRSYGAWGVAVSILLMVAHSFLPFPGEVIALANGMVYGPVWGVPVTWSGAMIGAWLSFGLARLLGRRFAEALLARRNLQALDDLSRLQGARVILITRLIPVIAFNLINYAAGLTAISWWSFTWSTALGILPLIILMNLLGHEMLDATWETWAMAGVGTIILCWVLLPKLKRLRIGVANDNRR